MEIPQKYKDIVGKRMEMSGNLFSYRHSTPPTEFDILDVRFGSARVINVTQLMEKGESEYEHPTVEFLVKNGSMSRSRWTRGFPVKEINLKADGKASL